MHLWFCLIMPPLYPSSQKTVIAKKKKETSGWYASEKTPKMLYSFSLLFWLFQPADNLTKTD